MGSLFCLIYLSIMLYIIAFFWSCFDFCWLPDLIYDKFFLSVFFNVNQGSSLISPCFLLKCTINFPGAARYHSLDQDLANANYNTWGQTVDGEVESGLAEGNLSAHRREC